MAELHGWSLATSGWLGAGLRKVGGACQIDGLLPVSTCMKGYQHVCRLCGRTEILDAEDSLYIACEKCKKDFRTMSEADAPKRLGN